MDELEQNEQNCSASDSGIDSNDLLNQISIDKNFEDSSSEILNNLNGSKLKIESDKRLESCSILSNSNDSSFQSDFQEYEERQKPWTLNLPVASSSTTVDDMLSISTDYDHLQRSRSVISKSHEVNEIEERDTFSPVSTDFVNDPQNEEVCNNICFAANNLEGTTINTEVDNKQNSKRKMNLTSTKEEKQRQNEEIVIMETSSISSETGSWESIFPNRTNNEVKDCCLIFLQHERRYCMQCLEKNTVENEKNEPFSSSQPSSSVAACFIDASTLLDEPELVYSNLCQKTTQESSTTQIDHKDSPEGECSKNTRLDRLESFHKSFELCKTKALSISRTDSCSSSSEDSPQKVSSLEEAANNLSDEEKLWKRENSRKQNGRIEVNDQYVSDAPNVFQSLYNKSTNSSSSDTVSSKETLPADNKDLIRLRMDNERKQGNLVFKNSIQQFSGHLISPITNFSEDDVNESAIASRLQIDEEQQKSDCIVFDTNNCSCTSQRFEEELDLEQASSCFVPETPHNSIVQIDPALKYDCKNISQLCNSENSTPIKIPKRTLKCDESAPIVSGGLSVQDFTPKQCESPAVRRKTDTCPIVSGGYASLDYCVNDNDKIKPREQLRLTQSVTSWIVDMSDCKSQRCRSRSSSSSTENTTRSVDESLVSKSKHYLGFYVPLENNEINVEQDHFEIPTRKKSQDLVKKSTGFFVDLSESDRSTTVTPPPSIQESTSSDKKNIFSMFIDFGEKKINSKRDSLPSTSSQLSHTLNYKKDTSAQKVEIATPKNSIRNYSLVEMQSDISVQSKTSSSSSSNDNKCIGSDETNTINDKAISLSWNTSETKNVKCSTPLDHKRSSSFSNDVIIPSTALPLKISSTAIDCSLSPLDDLTCSKSEISSYSTKSISITSTSTGDELGNSNKLRRHRSDVKINETFDKSSQGSLTDGILSKDLSPVSTLTEIGEFSAQQEDGLGASRPLFLGENEKSNSMDVIAEINETEIMNEEKIDSEVFEKIMAPKSPAHTMETLHATIEKQKQLLETVTEHVEISSNFVKLSDMDKPAAKFELHSPESAMSKSVGSHRHISRLFQEPRNRPHSWTMTRSTGSHLINVTSSVENLKSLSRLFPHLTKELSNSLPSNVSYEVNSRSPSEILEHIHSDLSEESSLASSISRSAMDESSISNRQPRRLGEDLLKMFLQEIGTDVIIEVSGRRIKAHKCILRSRCQYFAAILAGGWVESAGNVISLTGYSYSVVHFALCHIYSGASHPPEGISLMELAALADLLGLEGLKEVTAHALKINYCHNFHRPCSGCIDGTLQVLPVALNHALDDLYRKCLKWTCRHYLKVWPTRSFAQLPTDIFSRCRQQIVAHLSSETVLETILDCNQILIQLAPCRWGLAIENLVRDVLDAAQNYISDHFATLIASDSFLSLGHDKCSYISRLESVLLRTSSMLNADQACRSYQRITRLNSVLAAKVIKVPGISDLGNGFENETLEEEMDWHEEFIRLVSAILSAVEQCLIRQCARAMRVSAWQRMDLELRKKIQKLACLTEPLDVRRGKILQKQPMSYNRNHDLYQVKLAIRAHSKRSLSNESQMFKTTSHTQTHGNPNNIQTNEKGVQANNGGSDDHVSKIDKHFKQHKPVQSATQSNRSKSLEKSKALIVQKNEIQHSASTKSMKNTKQENIATASARLANIRPRYLEPKRSYPPMKSGTCSNITSIKNKQISSSDSSKTSSPAAGKMHILNKERKARSKSINISVDSLSSPAHKNEKLKNSKVGMEISMDSLADSMHSSSIKTDKTVSQESLIRIDLCGLRDQFSLKNTMRSNIINNKEKHIPKPISNKAVKNRAITGQTSGSSPSSITNKSSRLSSTTSSVDSPRDAYKNRSLSVPANQNNGVQRVSYLSAKSREILSKKTAKGEQCIQEKTTLISINKSASNSNIPKRRLIQPTTLHLRKTAKVIIPSTTSTLTTVAMNENSVKNINGPSHKNIASHKKNVKTNKLKENVFDNNKGNEIASELIVDSNGKINNEFPKESKLERSSTFCKEVSDFPTSELKIIE